MPQDPAVTDDAPNAPPTPANLAGAVEAILVTTDRPVTSQRLAEALGMVPQTEDGESPTSKRARARATEGIQAIDAAIAALNAQYAATGRSFRIESVAGGHRIMTLPEFAPALASFHKARAGGKLSRAAVETLAIIAYQQPVTRAQLEAIRGVTCGEVLRSLLERRLVEIKGRAEELGRPLLYGTGRPFLDAFGLGSIKDLPTATELQTSP